MKKRTVGSANPNSIGPRGKTVTQDYGNAKERILTTTTRGVGPVISDISLDEATNTLEIVRTANESSHNPLALKRGVLMHPVSSVSLSKGSKITGPEEWFPTTGVGNAKKIDLALSPILPDSFLHEEGFTSDKAWVSNLPEGMAWVRLSPHSPSVGNSSWDADEDDHEVVAEPEGGRGPILTFVTINAPSKSMTLWFDQPLHDDIDYTYKHRKAVHIVSNKAGIKMVGDAIQPHATKKNAVVIALDRVVSLDEDIYVRLERNMTRNPDGVFSRSSPSVSAVVVADKNCYVLTILTNSPAESASTLLAKSPVLLGTPVKVLDRQDGDEKKQIGNIIHSVTPAGDSRAASGGSSYGVVWGGATSPSSFGYSFLRYRPYTEWDLKGFQKVNVVDDWSKYVLPVGWTPADELTNTLPIGLGYVRLMPFSADLGIYTWQDTSFTSREDPIDAAPTIIESKITGTVVYITWNQPVTIIGAIPTISSSGAPLTASGGTSNFANIISYDLSRSVSPEEILTLAASPSWVEAAHDNQFSNTEIVSQTVKNVSLVGSMVLVANRVQPLLLSRGQVVLLKDNGFQLTDALGVTMSVMDIMPSTSVLPEHHHSSAIDGGYAISHSWSGQ